MSVLPVGVMASSTEYNIGNSFRFRSGAYLSRTAGTPSGTNRWTFSVWATPADLASGGNLLGAAFDSNNYARLTVSTSSVVFQAINVGSSTHFFTANWAPVDAAGWVHFVAAYDGALAASDRLKLYASGQPLTFVSAVCTSAATAVNTNLYAQYLGYGGPVALAPYTGNMAECRFIDGQALLPTSFGYTDTTTGKWKPKKYTGTYGNNGYYMAFANASSLAALGTDSSGRGNTLTVTGGSLTAGPTYDWMTNSPTNTYCMLNYRDTSVPTTGSKVYESGLTVTSVDSAYTVRATLPFVSGKYVAQCKVTAFSGAVNVGMIAAKAPIAATSSRLFYRSDGQKVVDGVASAYGASFGLNDVIRIEADYDAGTVTFFKNNVSQGSISYTMTAGYTFGTQLGASSTVSWNFGQQPWFDGETPSAAFRKPYTANLPTTANGYSVYAQAAATGDNIYASLAAARTGWTDYVDILKNRDAVGSWAWQFSYDSSNEYAVADNSVSRTTKRAISGSNNWVGKSIRIGAAYGTAAGSVTHTTGTPTTVTHGVGVSARQVIILFPRSGSTSLLAYHPDMTAGTLLDLTNTTTPTATSTAIGSVTSTSFVIGSATASGTYDYLVMSELAGVFAPISYTGIGTSPGPFQLQRMEVQELFLQCTSGAYSNNMWDTFRGPPNVGVLYLQHGRQAAEVSGSIGNVYLLSNGAQAVSTNNAMNASAATYVGWVWGVRSLKNAGTR